ncbi:GntR family transcriptional regulator [Halalkalibacterium ligniniphilum]|uniref:GntR family transcriptional regulator n=1 Tax=Halalkalibacterium ligniniphilum TaxID=1134413 RepID=UPI000346CC7A|nr:GntR family transcriptional regulator [Halalkalibacterium ligniniphilum]
MYLSINPKSKLPIYEQIVNQIRELVAKGILEEGEQLLSVRELSAQMVVNPNTISKAYKELERQGIIVTIRGKGTFVAEAKERVFDPKQIAELKEQVRRMVVDASYANIKKEELLNWIDEAYHSMEGKKE